jgi:Tfp pilus assembly protein PilF
MRQLAALALLLALGAAGCATGGREMEELRRLQARAAYERGITHFSDGQAGLALSAFQDAIALDGTAALYRNTLGLLLLHHLARPDMALEQFRAAVDMEPGYAEAHLNMGVALAEARRWDDAVAAYRKALGLPTLLAQETAYHNLGLALFHLQRYREAEEALAFALRLQPDMVAAYYNLGLVYAAQGRPADARTLFRRAHDLAPQSPFGQAAAERLKALGEGG